MPLELIDNPKVALGVLGAMAGVRELAVDTEGASFHRFVDRVYLLQISTRQTSAIVDPLAVAPEALAPLGALLESADVETVFHDADYDLRLLRRDDGWKVRRIFDTRIAAQLLGIKAFGLAALLEQYWQDILYRDIFPRYGIRNIRERLESYYGKSAEFTLKTSGQIGTEAAIDLPVK